MSIENRKHERFKPQGLDAIITIYPPAPKEEIYLQGTVVDMSYSGIRVKLCSAMPTDIPESKILINFTMPKSGLPIKIKGIIRHIDAESECGVKYAQQYPKDEVDELMLECIKTTEIH